MASAQNYGKGKQFKWSIPSATPQADLYNAPAKTKAGYKKSSVSAPPPRETLIERKEREKREAAASGGGRSSNASYNRAAEQKARYSAPKSSSAPKKTTTHTSAPKTSYQKPSSRSTSSALDADIDRVSKGFNSNASETSRRSETARGSSAVSGNADWVKGCKNAQEQEDAIAAQRWMEAVTGKRFVNGDLWETTKSGAYLCELINKVAPGTVKKYDKNARMPFTCMENMTLYITGCQKLGMRSGQTFRPPDLYEKRVSYPRAIINNIHALAKIAEDSRGYRGPTLEVAQVGGRKF
jgi:hypothetical protein